MNFHPIGGAPKMQWTFIGLTLLLVCANAADLDQTYCDYIYDHGCHKSPDPVGINHSEVKSHRPCSVDDVTDDIKFTILLSQDQSTSSGLLKVNFSLPAAECHYRVALLVDSSITNKNDCKNHVFHTSNAYENEIHSVEKIVCVAGNSNSTAEHKCQNNTFSMWYEHIFTGCYALRFTINGFKYSVRGNAFLVTDYRRTEVMEPKYRCYYEDRLDSEPSKELVTFALSISVLAGTAGMTLTLSPMSFLDGTRENACNQYSDAPLYTWDISMDNQAVLLKNCRLSKVQFDNDAHTKDLECNFELRGPRNASYCLTIELHDERCHRQTIWNPPPDGAGGEPACTWLQGCTRIPKNTSVIENNGMLQGSKQINPDNILLLPIAITVILIILMVTGTILFVYRLHSRHATHRVYVSTNLRTLKIATTTTELDSVETTDEEILKGSNNGDECDAIILLYARGSPTFMSLMSDFREILKMYCGCHVCDWYAAGEWDAVARVGPSTWVADLMKQKYRVVWIDTPRARSILDTQWSNNDLVSRKPPYDHYLDEEAISDFRDVALPTVLDLAKRSVGPELALQYNRHFVVRLEGFDAVNKRDDPFEDLSPNTRYLIPYHLSDLCSHLSSWRTTTNLEGLKTEEAQLRERLIRMKNNSS